MAEGLPVEMIGFIRRRDLFFAKLISPCMKGLRRTGDVQHTRHFLGTRAEMSRIFDNDDIGIVPGALFHQPQARRFRIQLKIPLPKRRHRINPVADLAAIRHLLAQQARPDQGFEHPGIQGAHFRVIGMRRIDGSVERLGQGASGDPALGLDINDVQPDVPSAHQAMILALIPEFIGLEQDGLGHCIESPEPLGKQLLPGIRHAQMAQIGAHQSHVSEELMHPPKGLKMMFVGDLLLAETVVDFLLGPIWELDRRYGLGNHHPPECPGFRQGNALWVLVELVFQERQGPLDGGAVQERVVIGKGAEAIHWRRIAATYRDRKGFD